MKERLKEETLLNPHSIRFYDSHSALWASHRAGIYRQRTEENVLKAQLVNFYRLTPKADFILIPFLCQQEITDVAVLDPVSAHVELIQRDNIFRVVIADIVIRAELTLNSLIGCQQIGNLNI